jgi:hypothetical protein
MGGSSLIAALNAARVPAGNHAFIRQMLDGIGGIGEVRVVDADSPYVVVSRRDGGRDLHVFYGYTTRFASEEEIIRACGPGAPRKAAKSPKGTWWVTHPVSGVYEGAERSKDRRREAGFCACGMQLALTGRCDDCD